MTAIPQSANVELVSDPLITGWDEIPKVDNSLVYYDHVDHYPVHGRQKVQDSPDSLIVFEQNVLTEYFDYMNSELEIRYKLVKATDGTDFAVTDIVAPVSDAAHFFSNATLKVDGKPIEDKQHAGIGSNMLTMIEASEDWIRTAGTAQGIYPDTGKGGIERESVDLITAHVNGNYNEGFHKRVLAHSTSAMQTATIPLRAFFGLFKDTSLILRGKRISIELKRNTDWTQIAHRTSAGANVNAKVYFDDIIWWVPKVRLNPLHSAALDLKLASGIEKTVLYRDWNVFESNILATDFSVNYRVQSLGKGARPLRILVAFKKESQLSDQTGQLTSEAGNGGVYYHGGVTRMQVSVNKIRYPDRPFTPDFGTNKWTREYKALLDAGGHGGIQRQVGSIISRNLFGTIYPIYCFDVSRREDTPYSKQTDSEIYIESTVNSTVSNPATAAVAMRMYVLVEVEREIVLKGTGDSFQVIV